jgi:hypothetical protein
MNSNKIVIYVNDETSEKIKTLERKIISETGSRRSRSQIAREVISKYIQKEIESND